VYGRGNRDAMRDEFSVNEAEFLRIMENCTILKLQKRSPSITQPLNDFVFMNAEPTRRSDSHWMMVAVAMLALAVFSWGVRYKVSLYHPVVHMSAAKLLSQRERPATIEAARLAADPLPAPQPLPFFTLALGALFATLRVLKPKFLHREPCNRTLSRRPPCHSFFFFRPPPVLFAAI